MENVAYIHIWWKAILNISRLNYCARKSTNTIYTPIIDVNTKAHFQYTIYIHRLIDCCFGILITIFHEFPFSTIFLRSQKTVKICLLYFSFRLQPQSKGFTFLRLHLQKLHLHLHLYFACFGFIFFNWGSFQTKINNNHQQKTYKYMLWNEDFLLSEKIQNCNH